VTRREGALALAVAAAACAPRLPPPDLSLDPAVLLAQVRAAQADVARVQGEARIHVSSRELSGSATHFLAAEKPDRLHVEALDFFGNPVLVLVAEGGRFALLDVRAKVFYRGAATPANLARLLPVRLSAGDLVTILCGSAPLSPGAPVEAVPGRGIVRLALGEGGVRQELEVGAGAAVRSSRVRAEGGGRLPGVTDVDFAFDDPDGGRFPTEVRLSSEDPRVRLELAWREVHPNAPVDAALFRLAPPRGVRVVDLAKGETVPSLPPPFAPSGDETRANGPSRD
jgi:hypothetical protein